MYVLVVPNCMKLMPICINFLHQVIQFCAQFVHFRASICMRTCRIASIRPGAPPHRSCEKELGAASGRCKGAALYRSCVPHKANICSQELRIKKGAAMRQLHFIFYFFIFPFYYSILSRFCQGAVSAQKETPSRRAWGRGIL